jgi:hypothetical protein
MIRLEHAFSLLLITSYWNFAAVKVLFRAQIDNKLTVTIELFVCYFMNTVKYPLFFSYIVKIWNGCYHKYTGQFKQPLPL